MKIVKAVSRPHNLLSKSTKGGMVHCAVGVPTRVPDDVEKEPFFAILKKEGHIVVLKAKLPDPEPEKLPEKKDEMQFVEEDGDEEEEDEEEDEDESEDESKDESKPEEKK
jgi:hypothetical protein